MYFTSFLSSLFRVLPTEGRQWAGTTQASGNVLVLPVTSLKVKGEASERFLGA